MHKKTRLLISIAWLGMLCTSVTATAVTVLPEELAQKDAWVQQNLLSTATVPFSFTYGGQSSSAILPSWTRTAATNDLDANRTQYTMIWTNAGNALQVRCVAVEYGDYPVVEWTVYLKNIGAGDTPIIQNIQGLDFKFQRGPASEFVLNGIKGDWCTEDSYQPYSYTLYASSTRSFEPQNDSGKSCDGPDGWPYFNLQMPGGGAILAVGWPGQWASSFMRDTSTGVVVKAGQELTYLLLHPGEEVRTPLIAVLFWQGTDIVRSQNLWRRWYLAHTMPRVNGNLPTPQAQIQIGGAASDTNYAQSFLDAGINVDLCWRDAGGGYTWYKNNESPYTGGDDWLNTGTWEVDPAKYPNGFKPFTDWIHGKGMKFALWFEPERVGDPNSWLGLNHPEWLMSPGSVGTILNEGNPAAFNWLTNHFDNLIKSNGVDWYREDMNGGGPGPTWRANDAGNRQGITENFYVQGHLAFWDALLAMNPGLRIDSCASGGRRNDLETMRRAVPLLRSDFQWTGNIHDGNQCHTYGLSSWLPFQGQGVYQYDPYSFRSFYMTSFGMGGLDSGTRAAQQQAYAECRIVAPCMLYGDYYPLTPYSLANTVWIAWQFDYPEKTNGVVQAFRRANSTDPMLTIRLQGLDDQRTYSVRDFDKGDLGKYSGSELMTVGLTLQLNQRDSAIIYYGPPTGVVVTASADVRAGRAPLAVAFSAVGTSTDGHPLTYAWTFGDGGTSTVTNPSHVYATNGLYTAEVTADDGHGNTDTDRIAISVVSAFVQAEGGAKQYVDLYGANYTIHTFTNIGATNLTVSRGGEVEVLVVAGGGGGGKAEANPNGDGAGGGGGGGVVYTQFLSIASGNHTVVVGGGGAGSSSGVYPDVPRGTNGSDSSFGTLVALGGGGGGSDNDNINGLNQGATGGCGGGTANAYNQAVAGGSGTPGQGKDGGAAQINPTTWRGGSGGGGAGSAGAARTSNSGGAGGAGLMIEITGSALAYAGGGGGGACGNNAGGYGGAGGGGAGGNNGAAGAAGTANTGGGGGGGASPAAGNISGGGGAGGSGIVIVRYLTGAADTPGIENRPVSAVTTNSATFNGALSATGGSACAVCVLWGETNGGQTWDWSHTNWFEGTGWTNNTPFSTNITVGISANKTYWYTFAATNATANAVASAPKFFITGEVTVRATDGEAQYPGNPGQFTIYRPSGCTNEALTVDFIMGGTEVENTDFTLAPSGGATLDAGATSKVVNLTATGVGNGTAILKLTPASGNAYPLGADSNATVIILATVMTNFAATGGTVTNYTTNGINYTVHLFTTVGTTSIVFMAGGSVDVLVVGGGGAGGANRGGGGGGGGVIHRNSCVVTSGSYTVTVGAGGVGGWTNVVATSGGDSAFGNLIAKGGGVGGDTWAGGATGGSGGGGGIYSPPTFPQVYGGSGTLLQGNGGGNGDGTAKSAGGGGGAGQAGSSASSVINGGNGGDGIYVAITGASVPYAGGGGGGGYDGRGGSGGVGGGGGGAWRNPLTNAVAGTPNTGGGGGGGTDDDVYPTKSLLGYQCLYGAAGGSGIVIVRYVTSPYELWRRTHFTAGELADLDISGDDADPDHDNFANLKEYLAGTIPTNTASVLAFSSIREETSGAVLCWQSATGKTYSILLSTNLITDRFTNSLIGNLPADPPVNVYTDTVDRLNGVFYRIGLEE